MKHILKGGGTWKKNFSLPMNFASGFVLVDLLHYAGEGMECLTLAEKEVSAMIRQKYKRGLIKISLKTKEAAPDQEYTASNVKHPSEEACFAI